MWDCDQFIMSVSKDSMTINGRTADGGQLFHSIESFSTDYTLMSRGVRKGKSLVFTTWFGLVHWVFAGTEVKDKDVVATDLVILEHQGDLLNYRLMEWATLDLSDGLKISKYYRQVRGQCELI